MVDFLPILKHSNFIGVEMSVTPVNVEMITVAIDFCKSMGFKNKSDQFRFCLLWKKKSSKIITRDKLKGKQIAWWLNKFNNSMVATRKYKVMKLQV